MNFLKVLGFKVNHLFFYFITSSFIGWCIETSYMFFTRGRFSNSGLLNGPFCPIYGFGGLLLIIFLKPIKHNIFLFFLGAVIVTTLLEYLTGFLIKITLNRMIWDYSGEFLSINGLICLKSSLAWGIISVIFMYLIKPILSYTFVHVPKNLRTILACSIAVFFAVKTGNWLWNSF